MSVDIDKIIPSILSKNKITDVVLVMDRYDYYDSLWDNSVHKELFMITVGQYPSIINGSEDGVSYTAMEVSRYFGISGFSPKPYIRDLNAIMLYVSNIYYKVDEFYSLVKEFADKNHNYIYRSRVRPTSLLDNFTLIKCRDVITAILLHYWYEANKLTFPKCITDILQLSTVPDDVSRCTRILLNSKTEDDISESERKDMIDTFFKYHCKNNKLLIFAGIDVSLDEFSPIVAMVKRMKGMDGFFNINWLAFDT